MEKEFVDVILPNFNYDNDKFIKKIWIKIVGHVVQW